MGFVYILMLIHRRNVWNLACSCILTTFRTDQILVTVCWISSSLYDLIRWAKFGVSTHFQENISKEWLEIWYADVFWPPSELIKFWSWSVDFPHLGTTLIYWDGPNLGVPCAGERTCGTNGLKFGVLIKYSDHLQNWLDFGQDLLIFLILLCLLCSSMPIWLAFCG